MPVFSIDPPKTKMIINRPRRFAFLLSNMDGGGAQRVMLNLAHGIAERGFFVDLVVVHAEGPLLAQIPKAVRLVDLNARRAATSLPALIRYLKLEQPEVVLAGMNYINVVALLARRLAHIATRVVVVEHSMSSFSARDATGLRMRFMPYLLYCYRWADAVIAVSQEVRNDLSAITGIPDDRIHVLYNPVITPELLRKAKDPLNHPWYYPDQPPVVLSVGRLSGVKDFQTLICAFAQVRRTYNVRLLILGEGDERAQLEALVRKFNLEQDVNLPGFVENPYPYMARSSLFVLASRHEALPTVLIEAMCFGTPIVATDCPGGTREILRSAGYYNLVPVGDADALARAIETALHQKRVNMTEENRFRFELNNVTEQYLSVILGGNTG